MSKQYVKVSVFHHMVNGYKNKMMNKVPRITSRATGISFFVLKEDEKLDKHLNTLVVQYKEKFYWCNPESTVERKIDLITWEQLKGWVEAILENANPANKLKA